MGLCVPHSQHFEDVPDVLCLKPRNNTAKPEMRGKSAWLYGISPGKAPVSGLCRIAALPGVWK